MTITSGKFFSFGLIGALLVALVPSVWALTPIEVAKLTASDGASYDAFGVSVAVDGDTALIGSWGDDDNGENSGSAYVFTRNAGVWTEQAKLTASDGTDFDYFGHSVAVDGDTALIGASEDDDNGLYSGSAYVFTRNAGVWTEQAKLTASDGASGAIFGWSVAVDGDTALIGAYGTGSAYVFTRNAGVWTEQAKLTASDRASGDTFGINVAVDGDTALIGAPRDDDNGLYSGSAYVFTRNAGVWTEQAKLTASDGASGDAFGVSVAVDGDTVLIGSWGDDDNGEFSGSAYVFTRNAGVWTEQAKLTASDGASVDDFGVSVAVDGNTALIGANEDDDNGENSGSAYVFTRNAGVWTEQAKLTASDGASDDEFGVSVAVDGDTALIGSWHDDDNGESSGSAYVFSLISETVVTIDIKPGKDPNIINIKSGGFIPVAILTEGEFDALQVDPNTAKFGPSEAIAERYKVKDVGRDGDEDLLLYFRIQQTGIACSDTQATLVGELYDGSDIMGTDSIKTVGCKPKKYDKKNEGHEKR